MVGREPQHYDPCSSSSVASDTRIILRSPDPACNPYLVLAASLEAGLNGIEGKIEPPPPFPGNSPEIKDMREIVRKEGLPRNLSEALRALADDTVIQGAMGEHISRRFLETRKRSGKGPG